MKLLSGISKRYLARSILYSTGVLWVVIALIFFQLSNAPWIYYTFGLFGFFVIFLELFFTVRYSNSPFHNQSHISLKRFLHQGVNHITYVMFTYLGLVGYVYFQDSIEVTIVYTAVVFLGMVFNFYILPFYIVNRKENTITKIFTHERVKLLMFVYKLFSYHMMNLFFFEMYSRSVIDSNVLFLLNFSLNFLYLFFFLYRNQQNYGINLFYAFLFSVITTLFILAVETPLFTLNASIATIFFYLASSFFYHKIDGTLTNDVLVEYGLLGTIMLVLLFSI